MKQIRVRIGCILTIVFFGLNSFASTGSLTVRNILLNHGFSEIGASGKEDVTIGTDGSLQCSFINQQASCSILTSTWGQASELG